MSLHVAPPSIVQEMSESSCERQRVLIFRNDVLPASETFIAAQAAAFRHYEPLFCGLRSAPNSILDQSANAQLLNRENNTIARYRRAIFLAAGLSPGWKRRLTRTQPVLIHAHFAVDAACALPLVSHLRVPLVVTLHGYDVTTHPWSMKTSLAGRTFLRRREQLFSKAHTFLCVSRFIRDRAIDKGFPAHKLVVHPIGIDLDSYCSRSDYVDFDRPLILFVGRLVEKKGCFDLLHATRLVQQQLPAARVTVIGDGPLNAELRNCAIQLGLRNCQFLGSQSSNVIRRLLRQAHVFCVPSTTAANGDSEGLGMVFLEAQAMGVPVVSTLHGGIHEAVIQQKTGLLVPERSPSALAKALLQVMQDRALWSRMSREGPSHVAAKYNLHHQTRLLEDMFTQFIRAS